MKAWPFLISASPHRDYTPVVVPDFIKEAGAVREVIRAAGGFETGPGEAIYFKGFRDGVGVVDLVFRVVDGTAAMLGQEGNEVLRDKQGRPIRLVEGIVLRNSLTEEPFTQAHLDDAHKAVEGHFRRFWNQEHHWESAASQGRDLRFGAGEKLRLQFKEAPQPHKVPAVPATTRGTMAESVKETWWKTNGKQTVAFCVVAGAALGAAYWAHRRSQKSKAQPERFADRVRQKSLPDHSPERG